MKASSKDPHECSADDESSHAAHPLRARSSPTQPCIRLD